MLYLLLTQAFANPIFGKYAYFPELCNREYIAIYETTVELGLPSGYMTLNSVRDPQGCRELFDQDTNDYIAKLCIQYADGNSLVGNLTTKSGTIITMKGKRCE